MSTIKCSLTPGRALSFFCCFLAWFGQSAPAPAADPGDAPKFWCVDARRLGLAAKLRLDSLQALANSNAPALFVIHRDADESWLQAMEKQLGRSETISADEALTRFGAAAPQVIYDPGKRWNVNIATTVAGVERAILTDRDLGRPTAFDCRNRWKSKPEAYRWALAEILPRCERGQLIYLDEKLAFLRDYAMQRRLFVINLDPLNDAREIKLLDEILGRFPVQTRVFGWASGSFARKDQGQNGVTVEVALVKRLSQRGLMLVPADFASNLSFYSRTGSRVGRLAQQRLHRELRFQPDKRYILLVVSDGDNLQYDLGTMRARWEAERPKVPLAWSISPQWAEVGPAVLVAYYEEAFARGGWDEFVAGPSGYAYVNPGSMSAARLGEFLQSTRQAAQQADLSSTVILDDGARPAAQVSAFIRAYAAAKLDGLWLAAMPRYVGVFGQTAFVNERFRLNPQNAAEIAQQVKQVKTEDPFVMIYVDGWSQVGKAIREFTQALDDSCVVVSPTEMADLIRQWARPSPP